MILKAGQGASGGLSIVLAGVLMAVLLAGCASRPAPQRLPPDYAVAARSDGAFAVVEEGPLKDPDGCIIEVGQVKL